MTGGSWSTTAPTWVDGKYIWTRNVTKLTNNTTSTSKAVCITGGKGATGSTGTGIASITEEYYVSTSKTTQTGGSWSTTSPTWSTGKYIWTRSKIVYKNPTSTAYTTPVCDSSWEAVNELDDEINSIKTTATTALNSANSKNTIYYSNEQPTGGTYKVGDTWFDTDDGNRIYNWTGSSWLAKQLGTNAIKELAITTALIADAAITNAKISNLDAAKITSGTIDTNRLNVNAIFAKDITATGTITGATLIGGVIKSSNYEDNGNEKYDSNGNPNNKYTVKRGVMIDLINMMIKTPQITIGENYIRNDGWFINGYINKTKLAGNHDKGIEYGTIANGIKNYAPALCSIISGTNNDVEVSEKNLSRDFSEEITSINQIAIKNLCSLEIKFNTTHAGLYVETTYADISQQINWKIYNNSDNKLLYEGSVGHTITKGVKCSYVTSSYITFNLTEDLTYDLNYDIWYERGDYTRVTLEWTDMLGLWENETYSTVIGAWRYEFTLKGAYLQMYKLVSALNNVHMFGKSLTCKYSEQTVVGFLNDKNVDAYFVVGDGGNNRSTHFHNALWVDKEEGHVNCHTIRISDESGYAIMQKGADGDYKTLITLGGGNNNKNYYICNSKPASTDSELCLGHNDLKYTHIKGQTVRFNGNLLLSPGKTISCNWTDNTWRNLIQMGNNGAVYIANSEPPKDANGNYMHMVIGHDKMKCIYMNCARIRFGFENNYVDFINGAFRALQPGINLGTSGAANRFNDLYLIGNVFAKGGSSALTSDRRAKPFIEDLTYYHDIVMKIRWVDYIYNSEIASSGRVHAGAIAQEVEEVLNSLGIDRAVFVKVPIVDKPLKECTDDEVEYSLRYTEFIPYIGRELQDVVNDVTDLKNRVTSLEAKVEQQNTTIETQNQTIKEQNSKIETLTNEVEELKKMVQELLNK